MKPSLMKLIAAVVIAVVVLLGIVFHGSGIMPNDVLERIEQTKAFTYEVKMTLMGVPAGGLSQMDIKAVIAQDSGTRITAYAGGRPSHETFVLKDEELVITVMPEQKQHMRQRLTHDIYQKIQAKYGDPIALIKQFAHNESVTLGQSKVNGINVKGFESKYLNITDGVFNTAVGRFWVDVDTKLPTQIEIDFKGENGQVMKKMLVHDLVWDVQLESNLFEVNIPSESALVLDEWELLPEERCYVEVLELFAKLTGGTYPSTLNITTIEQEFRDAMVTNLSHPMTETLRSETIQKLENLLTEIGNHTKSGNLLTEIGDRTILGSLLTGIRDRANLVKSSYVDLAYYGDTVTTEFPHAVLMRWKGDDGMYKVICGDLSAKKAAPTKLEELETVPLNLKPNAIKPYPANQAEGFALTALTLTWLPGIHAVAHQVYFGNAPDKLSLLAEVTTESTQSPTLQRGVIYYWRVDEVGSDGSIVTGRVWSFNSGQLVAHWKLDDGSGSTAANSISSAYHGRLVGNPTWTQGIIDGALQFDGIGDYVEIVDSNDFAVTNQITVCAWIKTDKLLRRYQSIVTKGDRSWRLQGQRDNFALAFGCAGLTVSNGNPWGSVYGKTEVDDGRWHHVAGVYDGEKISLYIDSQLDHSEDASGSIRFDDKQVRIGSNSDYPSRTWYGLIDDVRIYSYGMTGQEVAALSFRK